MARVISLHSFRRGIGKTALTANLAALMATAGRRVAVVDTDLETPSLHLLFGVNPDNLPRSLNTYLSHECSLREAAYDMSAALGVAAPGQMWLVPCSTDSTQITRVLRDGYDVDWLEQGLEQLQQELHLDVVVLDTHAGLYDVTLLLIAISDVLVVLLHPDRQGYQGTAVTVELARKLGVPRLGLIVNEVPAASDLAATRAHAEQTFECDVAAVIPHTDAMQALASTGIFVLHYPDHPVTAMLREAAQRLTA
jgi:septum site-determining protein MinD